jgi:hypothetical protein
MILETEMLKLRPFQSDDVKAIAWRRDRTAAKRDARYWRGAESPTSPQDF